VASGEWPMASGFRIRLLAHGHEWTKLQLRGSGLHRAWDREKDRYRCKTSMSSSKVGVRCRSGGRWLGRERRLLCMQMPSVAGVGQIELTVAAIQCTRLALALVTGRGGLVLEKVRLVQRRVSFGTGWSEASSVGSGRVESVDTSLGA